MPTVQEHPMIFPEKCALGPVGELRWPSWRRWFLPIPGAIRRSEGPARAVQASLGGKRDPRHRRGVRTGIQSRRCRGRAALWTKDGSAADDNGAIYKGRAAIEEQYAELFKQRPARMEVAVKSIEFPTPTTAIEDGITQVEAENAGPPQASRYTVVHIKQDGKWLMASVRESSIELPSNFARVESLGWLVGPGRPNATERHPHHDSLDRQQELPGTRVHDPQGRHCRFLGQADHRLGSESPANSLVVVRCLRRTWHGTLGGHARRLADRIVRRNAQRPPTASRNVLIRVPGEDNVLGWRSVARSVGGTSLPDTPEVVLDRVSEKKLENTGWG